MICVHINLHARESHVFYKPKLFWFLSVKVFHNRLGVLFFLEGMFVFECGKVMHVIRMYVRVSSV